jgi:3-oxoacyl-[acyl-carrier-protein] synthase II
VRKDPRERVVITGLGMVTPLGLDASSSWAALRAGRSGVERVRSFDASSFRCQIAAEVKEFDPSRRMPGKLARRLDRAGQLALTATVEALESSGLKIDASNAERVGVLVSSAAGGVGTLCQQYEQLLTRGEATVTPFLTAMFLPDMICGQISIHLGTRGPAVNISSACATSANSIGEAAEMIRHGRADAILAGGTDACAIPVVIAAFSAMHALSLRNDDPAHASRPFDRDRDGMVVGEGAGAVMLESLDHATRRGAPIVAELLGYGTTSDAHHITAPPDQGEGLQRAICHAFDGSGVGLADVAYVNAHATATAQGDAAESRALRAVFGRHADELAVSSTKSMTGHLLGAAGAVEAIVCALAIRDGVMPPTINLDNPDPACDLDYIPHVARERRVDVALSNSLGFGGRNAALLLARPDLG